MPPCWLPCPGAPAWQPQRCTTTTLLPLLLLLLLLLLVEMQGQEGLALLLPGPWQPCSRARLWQPMGGAAAVSRRRSCTQQWGAH